MQKQLVDGHALGDHAVGIALNGVALVLGLQVFLLDVALEYGLVAHHPRHLFGNVVLRTDAEHGGNYE